MLATYYEGYLGYIYGFDEEEHFVDLLVAGSSCCTTETSLEKLVVDHLLLLHFHVDTSHSSIDAVVTG